MHRDPDPGRRGGRIRRHVDVLCGFGRGINVTEGSGRVACLVEMNGTYVLEEGGKEIGEPRLEIGGTNGGVGSGLGKMLFGRRK